MKSRIRQSEINRRRRRDLLRYIESFADPAERSIAEASCREELDSIAFWNRIAEQTERFEREQGLFDAVRQIVQDYDVAKPAPPAVPEPVSPPPP